MVRIGLVWAGNPRQQNDRDRSLPLKALAPLANVPDVEFVSLQMGHGRDQIGDWPGALEDPTPGIRDFADTAGILEDLDLMISVDTSVAHLAGTLGVPCWVVLGADPDWRYPREGEANPWYPSQRLFHRAPMQKGPDWSGVVAALVRALEERVASRSG